MVASSSRSMIRIEQRGELRMALHDLLRTTGRRCRRGKYCLSSFSTRSLKSFRRPSVV